jgi:hypothetical protein
MSNAINKNMKRTVLAVSAALTIASCGYSDYPGKPGHKTQKEAYMPSLTTTITGYGENYDGTYVYSVKYDNTKWMKRNYKFKTQITGYRNIAVNSNPHRPGVVTDADSFHNAKGFSGGKFKRYWVATDTDANEDGGLDNFDQSFPLDENGEWIEPMLLLSLNDSGTEVDKIDSDLQSSVKNASSLISNIVRNGGSLESLKMKVNALEFNGVKVAVDPYEIGFSIGQMGLNKIALQNQASTKSVVNAILNNTQDLKKVDLKLHFANGMEIEMPTSFSIMFNHKALQKLVK